MASANPTFYADIRNPQSLNKYAYAYNNPLRYTDPDGHCPVCPALPWVVPPAVAAGKAVVWTGATLGAAWLASKIEPKQLLQKAIDYPAGLKIESAGGTFGVAGEGGFTLKATQEGQESGNEGSEGSYAPDRELPRDANGKPVPESANPHTQLGGEHPGPRERRTLKAESSGRTASMFETLTSQITVERIIQIPTSIALIQGPVRDYHRSHRNQNEHAS